MDAETGGIGDVLGDDDGARVVGVVVVPSNKLKTDVGRSRNLDGIAIIIGAAARHCTPSGMVGFDFDNALADGKQGNESAVLEDDDVARVAEITIVPAEELMARVGMGIDGDGVSIVVCAASADHAPVGVVSFDGDGVFRLGWDRLHNEVGDDAPLLGMIQDFAIFINRLCIGIIHPVLVDNQVADSRKLRQIVEHFAVLPNINNGICQGNPTPV